MDPTGLSYRAASGIRRRRPAILQLICLLIAAMVSPRLVRADPWDHNQRLNLPPVEAGRPAAGRRIRSVAPEYQDTEVHHTIYLPPHWRRDGDPLPIIFEYTGNHAPQLGSTGEVRDAALGYCLSAGRFIWVVLPCINPDHTRNEGTWWGDVDATVDYAKTNVPRILKQFHADPQNVFLCGFSRGAIGVSLIGLHDDEIASLWTAFITHDHFDGVQEWKNTDWGTPLNRYRQQAAQRLSRLKGRPVLVCQHGTYRTQDWLAQILPSLQNVRFLNVRVDQLFESFPNTVCRHPHTDRWAVVPGPDRTTAWQWVLQTVRQSRTADP